MRNLSILIVILLSTACGKDEAKKDEPKGDSPREEYVKKSKSTEAMMNVKKIYHGARAYYEEESLGAGSAAPLPKQFPASVPMTPAAGACCQGENHRCAPSASTWNQPGWMALQFSVDDPHYYSYEFVSTGTAFTARAVGDLDCDGEYSTFEMSGTVDAEGNVTGAAGLFKNKETE